jgi:hypothetical protein
MARLPPPKGIDGLPVPILPRTYDEFRGWFPNWVQFQLAPGDVRNSSTDGNISVTGNALTPATLGLGTGMINLLTESFILAAPPSGDPLTGYRTLASDGVIQVTDGGAEHAFTISFRQSAATSVVGNPLDVLSTVTDITAPADGTVLQRAGGNLTFASLPLTAIIPQADQTVLANLSGGPAAPAAVSTVGAAAGVALADTGVWTPTVYGASVAGTTTYVIQDGSYTRIADMVFFRCRVSWTAVTGSGYFMVGGLPFPARSSANNVDSPVNVYVVGSLTAIQAPVVMVGTTTIEMDKFVVGSPAAAAQALPAAGDLLINGFYPI